MSNALVNELEERFLRYVKIDTTADPASSTSPSSRVQLDLLNLLVDELKQIGARDVVLTDYGAGNRGMHPAGALVGAGRAGRAEARARPRVADGHGGGRRWDGYAMRPIEWRRR
jgi:tripeptide aminopeptidase